MAELNVAQRALRAKARALAEGEILARAEIDRTEAYPWDHAELLTEAGFMGMTLPIELGGQGRSYFDAVLVIEEIARACGVTGRIVVEANMGGIGAIMAYGSETHKRLAADVVLAGDKPAICITEPGAGSAVTDMTTTAVKHGNTYVINGKKHWITGGGVSRLRLVFARVVEHGESQGICGFMCLRDETKGLSIGRREPAMGLRGIPETEVIFDNMEVRESMMVVPPEGLKRGFARLMSAYNAQRIGAATVALGVALAEGLRDARRGNYALAVEKIGRVRYQLDQIGGSAAQRDVFFMILLDATASGENALKARSLFAERVEQRVQSSCSWHGYSNALTALGDGTGARAAAARAAAIRSIT